MRHCCFFVVIVLPLLSNSGQKVQCFALWLLDSKLFSSYLVLFEICPDSPAFVICQCVSVLLEKCVDTGDSSVPRVFQILKGETPKTQKTPRYFPCPV